MDNCHLFRVAVGTCHGFAAYDYQVGKVALVKCTISPTGKAIISYSLAPAFLFLGKPFSF